mmetsp:Transcript_9616/g.27415  ORF Transcript_9616/g.27415 Transcript_9616/m.27415 type:complete len:211 (-) Transcript_9616:3-635(-)
MRCLVLTLIANMALLHLSCVNLHRCFLAFVTTAGALVIHHCIFLFFPVSFRRARKVFLANILNRLHCPLVFLVLLALLDETPSHFQPKYKANRIGSTHRCSENWVIHRISGVMMGPLSHVLFVGHTNLLLVVLTSLVVESSTAVECILERIIFLVGAIVIGLHSHQGGDYHRPFLNPPSLQPPCRIGDLVSRCPHFHDIREDAIHVFRYT